MTLREMAEEYRDAAWKLRQRAAELEERARASETLDGCRELEERSRALRQVFREVRDQAVLLERYYDRGYRRNGRYTV